MGRQNQWQGGFYCENKGSADSDLGPDPSSLFLCCVTLALSLNLSGFSFLICNMEAITVSVELLWELNGIVLIKKWCPRLAPGRLVILLRTESNSWRPQILLAGVRTVEKVCFHILIFCLFVCLFFKF